jgi:hypothetical protein
MSNDQHYLQQIAQMRAAKQQEELAVERNQAIYGYQESLKNRQEIERMAATTADADERQALRDQWFYFDAEVQANEANLRKLTPPPQADPKAVAYLQRRSPFLQKYGQKGMQAFQLAHNHLASTGNWKIGSPAYYKAIDTLLEMYGPDYGMRFDPSSDISLSPNEAAKISGLSPESYNRGVQAMHRQGRLGLYKK